MKFGSTYYPEHWPEERWEKDAQLMEEANINTVRIGEFAWSKFEPKEGEFDFSWLDRDLEILSKHGISVILGTPTATPPKWLLDKYPDMYMLDHKGITRNFGGRITRCHNNPTFQQYTRLIVGKMVEHYKDHPSVIAYQIDNELGCHNTTRCYCDNCLKGFQKWAENKYKTIGKVNEAWGTMFWSQIYNSFDEIILPKYTTTSEDPNNHGHNPGLMLDFYRFSSDSIIKYQQIQIDELRRHTNKIITHNFMGLFNEVDYYNLGKNLDVISVDNYPAGYTQLTSIETSTALTALNHEMIRGIKKKNHWVMEFQSGPSGWSSFTGTPKPGQIRLWTYQTIAHGAEAMMYFRWRPCLTGTEQHWFGILDHDGIPRRRYLEIKRVGGELKKLSDWIVGSKTISDVAMIRHYDNDWSHQISPHVRNFRYLRTFIQYYGILHASHINVDLTNLDRDLSKYKLVVAPLLNIMNDKYENKLQNYVRNGGNLIITFRSGTRNMDNSMTTTTLPGYFKELAGIEIEEFYPIINRNEKVKIEGQIGEAPAWFESNFWCDVIKITSPSVRIIATYNSHFFRGKPAITASKYGKGTVYYIGCDLDPIGLNSVMQMIAMESGISTNIPRTDTGIESIKKMSDDKQYLMVLNHNNKFSKIRIPGHYIDLLTDKKFEDEVNLEPYGVVMLTPTY